MRAIVSEQNATCIDRPQIVTGRDNSSLDWKCAHLRAADEFEGSGSGVDDCFAAQVKLHVLIGGVCVENVGLLSVKSDDGSHVGECRRREVR